jgi:hypothetical protein
MNRKRSSGMTFSVMQVGLLVVLAGMACFLFGTMAGYTYRSMEAPSQVQDNSNIATTSGTPITRLPTESVPPTWTWTPEATNVPPPTRTPRPINDSVPTWTPRPTATPIPTVSPLLGQIDVDQWELSITGVESLPGQSPNQQIVVIFVTLTNNGSEGTFSPYYTLELTDTQGRRYTHDIPATSNVRNRYGIDLYADVSMPPDSTAEVLYAYVAPRTERTFTIVPGDLVSSWSGNVTFSLP